MHLRVKSPVQHAGRGVLHPRPVRALRHTQDRLPAHRLRGVRRQVRPVQAVSVRVQGGKRTVRVGHTHPHLQNCSLFYQTTYCICCVQREQHAFPAEMINVSKGTERAREIHSGAAKTFLRQGRAGETRPGAPGNSLIRRERMSNNTRTRKRVSAPDCTSKPTKFVESFRQ